MQDLGLLEANWRLSRSPHDFERLRQAYLSLGLEQELAEIEFNHLRPFLENFASKYFDWGGSVIPAHRGATKASIDEAVELLTREAALIGLSSSYHYNRSFLPNTYGVTNLHLRELATLHKTLAVEAWRDDDSYFGQALFITLDDAKDFKDAMIRHHGYFGEEAIISEIKKPRQFPDLEFCFKVEWNVGK